METAEYSHIGEHIAVIGPLPDDHGQEAEGDTFAIGGADLDLTVSKDYDGVTFAFEFGSGSITVYGALTVDGAELERLIAFLAEYERGEA